MVKYSGCLLGKVQLDGAIRSETLANVVQSLVYRYYSPDSGSKLIYDHNRYSVECSENGLKLCAVNPMVKSKDEGFESDCESNLSAKASLGDSGDLSHLIESLQVSSKSKYPSSSSSEDGVLPTSSSSISSSSRNSSSDALIPELFQSCPPKLVFNGGDDNNSSSGNGSDSEELSLTSIDKLHHSWEEVAYLENTYSYAIEHVVFCHCDANYPSTLVWVVRKSSSMIGLVVKFRQMSEASNLFQAYKDSRVNSKPKYAGLSIGRAGLTKDMVQSTPSLYFEQPSSDNSKLLEQQVRDAEYSPFGEQVICIKPKPAYAEPPPRTLNYLFDPENFHSTLRHSGSPPPPKSISQCTFDLDQEERKTLIQKLKRHNLGTSTNPVVTMPRNFLNKIFNPSSTRTTTLKAFNNNNAESINYSSASSSSNLSDPETEASDSSRMSCSDGNTSSVFDYCPPSILKTSTVSHEDRERFNHQMLKPNHLVGSISRSKLKSLRSNSTSALAIAETASSSSNNNSNFNSSQQPQLADPDSITVLVETTSILKGSKTLAETVRKTTPAAIPAVPTPTTTAAAKKPVLLVPTKVESVRQQPSRYPKEAYFTGSMSRNSSTFAPYQRSLNFYHPAVASAVRSRGGSSSSKTSEFGVLTRSHDGRPVLVPFSSWMELSSEIPPPGLKPESKSRPSKKRSIGNLKSVNGTSKVLLRDSPGYHHGMWSTFSQKFKRNFKDNLVPKLNRMFTGEESPKRKPSKGVTFNDWATVQMI